MMKSRSKLNLFLPLLALGIVLISCQLPSFATPVTLSTPTPDLTLTALYSLLFTVTAQPPVQEIPPTDTLVPVVPTEIPPSALPTDTSVPPPVPSDTAVPTSTTAPTRTPVPTNTSRPLEGGGPRRGSTIAAFYLQEEPDIDGSFGEWDLERYDVDEVVYGAENWRGEDDLSANVMVAWDDNYLYLAARVRDDRYAQNASGKNLFKGDSIEILLDRNLSGDYFLDELSGDDYQLGISPGEGKPGLDTQAYLWYPSGKAGETFQVDAVGVETESGYRIEARISWRLFDISPDIGSRFGFAFSLSDNDNEDRNIQQSMVSNVATRLLTDPTTWGNLVLEGRAR